MRIGYKKTGLEVREKRMEGKEEGKIKYKKASQKKDEAG